jgi:flagellar export protein FliJ
MARFRFRLATVLKLREATRDERRGQLAEAYLAESKLRDRREVVEQELAELKALSGHAASGSVDVERLLAASRFEAILRAEIQLIRQHETTLAAEIEKRRQALVIADRDVRVLEKLEETQRDRHRQTEAAASMKQLDEFAGRQSPVEERY